MPDIPNALGLSSLHSSSFSPARSTETGKANPKASSKNQRSLIKLVIKIAVPMTGVAFISVLILVTLMCKRSHHKQASMHPYGIHGITRSEANNRLNNKQWLYNKEYSTVEPYPVPVQTPRASVNRNPKYLFFKRGLSHQNDAVGGEVIATLTSRHVPLQSHLGPFQHTQALSVPQIGPICDVQNHLKDNRQPTNPDSNFVYGLTHSFQSTDHIPLILKTRAHLVLAHLSTFAARTI